MNRISLWTITDTLREILERIEAGGGELTPEDESALDRAESDFAGKVEAVALFIRETAVTAAAIESEAKRLQDRARTLKGTETRLKKYLHQCLILADEKSVTTPKITVRRQKNGRPSIRWTRSVEDLPEDFRRVTVDVNGEKAYEEFRRDPESLPDGFQVELGEHIRIS